MTGFEPALIAEGQMPTCVPGVATSTMSVGRPEIV